MDRGPSPMTILSSSMLLLDILRAEPVRTLAGIDHFLLVRLARTGLLPFVRNLEFATTHLIPSSNEALGLRSSPPVLCKSRYLSDQTFRQFGLTDVSDLVALVIAAIRARSVSTGRGLRASRLRAIKAYVLENFCNQQLSLRGVALTQRITPRYVHKLFEAEGTTFSEHVLTLRLMRTYQMLSDPGCIDMTITDIALSAGFGDLSYFDRTFRRRFGATPSDVRHSIPRE